MKKNIAIIGSGITGLTIAYYLKKAGIGFRIFEKSNHIGGVINTVSENGFLFETGPNSGTLSNTQTVRLFEELSDKFELELANNSAKKRLILKNNKWYALPSGLFSAVTTPLFSFKDKLRILGEPFRKPGNNPLETVSELVVRRLGKSFLDYAIDPFISGIYAGNPDYLVTKYALPKLYNLEQQYGSFIKGAIKKAKEPKTDIEKKVTKDIFSAKGGLIQIVNAIIKKIGTENIELNKSIGITKNDNFYLIDGQEYSSVVSTVNASELPDLLTFADKNVLQDIVNTKYAKVTEITIGFKKWNGIKLDAFGGLIPSKEKKNILGLLFMSTLFKDRAPEGGALFTTFTGGTKKENLAELSEAELKEFLEPELKELLGLSEFKPDLFRAFKHKKAIAQYGADSEKRLAAIKKIERENKDLFLAGSIRDGVGLADRIKQATDIAEQIIVD